jgi:hypothetical protein
MKDAVLLEEIRRAVAEYRANVLHIGNLADRLLFLRDKLQFVDSAWYRDLTQHIVTLDSASTFAPTSDTDAQQLRSAIDIAIAAILRLIQQKLNGLE